MRSATNNSPVLSDMRNEDNPLVSVVVITYNSMLYVQKTLESILAQSYSNLEIIISDDASSDETVTFCSQWLQKNGNRFKRTRVVTLSVNTGIPANANRRRYVTGYIVGRCHEKIR